MEIGKYKCPLVSSTLFALSPTTGVEIGKYKCPPVLSTLFALSPTTGVQIGKYKCLPVSSTLFADEMDRISQVGPWPRSSGVFISVTCVMSSLTHGIGHSARVHLDASTTEPLHETDPVTITDTTDPTTTTTSLERLYDAPADRPRVDLKLTHHPPHRAMRTRKAHTLVMILLPLPVASAV